MEKRTIAIISIVAIVVIGVIAGGGWWVTHYSVDIDKVGVVTDQFGGILRVQRGPYGWAEKSAWETVKYYKVAVQTEEMLSDIKKEVMENVTVDVVIPGPSSGLNYGCLSATSHDKISADIDIAVQWHIDVNQTNDEHRPVPWEVNVTTLYTNYPDEGYAKQTLFNAVRDFARNYANEFTIDDLVGDRTTYENGLTPYVRNEININMTTLGGAVIIDHIYVRRVTAPGYLQVQYNKAKVATEEAKSIMILANATRDASIQVAVGQSQAIELVINVTQEAMMRLQSQGLNATEAAEYLLGQYAWDSLKDMVAKNPNIPITIFLDAPQATYTVPIKPNP